MQTLLNKQTSQKTAEIATRINDILLYWGCYITIPIDGIINITLCRENKPDVSLGAATPETLVSFLQGVFATIEIFKLSQKLPEVLESLESLHKCCDEAITEVWDKSDDGFLEMQYSIEGIQTILHNIKGN